MLAVKKPRSPKTSKIRAELTARCRSRRGVMTDVRVLDLSIVGCMFETPTLLFRAGDRVLVSLAGLSYAPAHVTWVEEDRAALTFEQQLYTPVLDHLLKHFAIAER